MLIIYTIYGELEQRRALEKVLHGHQETPNLQCSSNAIHVRAREARGEENLALRVRVHFIALEPANPPVLQARKIPQLILITVNDPTEFSSLLMLGKIFGFCLHWMIYG